MWRRPAGGCSPSKFVQSDVPFVASLRENKLYVYDLALEGVQDDVLFTQRVSNRLLHNIGFSAIGVLAEEAVLYFRCEDLTRRDRISTVRNCTHCPQLVETRPIMHFIHSQLKTRPSWLGMKSTKGKLSQLN